MYCTVLYKPTDLRSSRSHTVPTSTLQCREKSVQPSSLFKPFSIQPFPFSPCRVISEMVRDCHPVFPVHALAILQFLGWPLSSSSFPNYHHHHHSSSSRHRRGDCAAGRSISQVGNLMHHHAELTRGSPSFSSCFASLPAYPV